MFSLVKRTRNGVCVPRDIAQMQKMHTWAKLRHDAGQVIVGPGPKGPRTQRDSIGTQVYSAKDSLKIGRGRHDPRQSQQRKRRIIRVAAQAHSKRLRNRGHFAQKVHQMVAQLVGADCIIFGQMGPNIGQGELFGRPGQAKDHVCQKALPVQICHFGVALCGLGHNLGRKVSRGAGPRQNMNVKGGKVGQVKPHATRAVGARPFQISPGPIQNRHEVVTDHLYPCIGQMMQPRFPIGDMAPPVTFLLLDRLGHRQAFDHLPLQARRAAVFHPANLILPGGNLVGCPPRPGRDMMQCRNHALHPRLPHIINRSCVFWPKPPPGLSHIRGPFRLSTSQLSLVRPRA